MARSWSVENVYRHLAEQRDDRFNKTEVILHAVTEVGQPVIFGILIIILVFLPILTLQGMEGKMFQPLAQYDHYRARRVAGAVADVISRALRDGAEAREPKRIPSCCAGSNGSIFRRCTGRWAIASWCWPLRLVLLGASLSLFPFLGGEFIPILNEGAISPQTIRYPSIALDKSIEIEKEMQRAVLEFPEVRMVVSKIGRSELGNDPQEPNASDPGRQSPIPMDQWTTAKTKSALDDAIRKRIEKVPGANFLLSQPIQQRVDELFSGVRSEATVKVLGDDLAVLENYGGKDSGDHGHGEGRGRCSRRATLRPDLPDDRYRSRQDRPVRHQCRAYSGNHHDGDRPGSGHPCL